MVRARIIDVAPQTSSSSVSPIGGKVNATDAIAPEVDFSYFFTDNLALELIAATTQHRLSASNITALHGANLEVGKTWVLPPALTAQYHFFPHGPLSPYLGAGINYTVFYDTQAPGSGSPVTRMKLENNFGYVLQAGVDWNVSGNWFLNADVKQIFLDTTAKLTTALGPVKAKTALNPTVVGLGIGYRF
jgi:outer membrane protein